PAGTEKLLKTAEEMAKADSKQFQYNGAIILARTAGGMKKYDVSLKFFKICADIAKSVRSSSKLGEAFEGQIQVLYIMKKYDEAEKVAQSFLELEGDEKLEDMKFGVVEQLIEAKAKQGKIAEALKMTDGLLSEVKGEGEWYFKRLKAWVLLEAG